MISGNESPQIKALKTAIDTHAQPELFEVDYISLGKYHYKICERLIANHNLKNGCYIPL